MKTIPLTQGYEALVDDQDYERVSEHSWCVQKTPSPGLFYARSKIDSKRIGLHTFVMGPAPAGREWDHKDHDGLNCQRANLRPVTRSENCHNRLTISKTGFRGVTHNHGGFQARIQKSRVYIDLGTYPTREQAARAYDRVALILYGEVAILNFPGSYQ